MEYRRYQIELDEDQLKALSFICDRYSRLVCGQLSESLLEVCEAAWERRNRKTERQPVSSLKGYDEMKEDVQKSIDSLKSMCWGLGRYADYGVHYSEFSDMLYDMHQVMGNLLLKEKMESNGSSGRDHVRPISNVSDKPLIKVKRL